MYADEQLTVADNSRVTLAFRRNGTVERIVQPGTFTVTPDGCQPRKGIVQLPLSQQRAVLGKIGKEVGRDLSHIVQGGRRGGSHRPIRAGRASHSTDANPTPGESGTRERFAPLPGATLLEDKPEVLLARPGRCADSTGSACAPLGNGVWSARTEQTELEYAGSSPLTPARRSHGK